MSEAPAIGISEPRQIRDGRFVVEAVVSDTPGLIHRFIEATPKDADAAARSFAHDRLNKFHKSEAAKHARARERIDQARSARQQAAMAQEAG